MYPIAAMAAGAEPVAAPETDLTTDVDALLENVTPRTRIVFLANPNNPTGTYIGSEAVARLHAGLPDDVLLVLDAAYAEYVGRNDYTDGAELVGAARNVVMTRTSSKIHALAGLRVGWAYGSAQVADVLNRVRGPFNVGAPGQAAAIAAIRDRAHVTTAREQAQQILNWFPDHLRALGFEAPLSVCNFQLVRFPETPSLNAKRAYDHLVENGILTRRMAGCGLPDCLRIGIGTQAEMRVVADVLSRFAKGAPE